MREFCIMEIGQWGNCDKRIWWLIGGDKTRFYCISIKSFYSVEKNYNQIKVRISISS